MLYLVPRPHVAGLGTRFMFTAVLLNFCTLTFVNCCECARARAQKNVGVAAPSRSCSMHANLEDL